MYNQQVTIHKMTDTDGGVVATYVIGAECKMRRAKMMPLWQFRETYIPAEGLWGHYFHCNKCEWERRTIAYCKYCETPMTEHGSPGQITRVVNNTRVYKLRSDLLQRVRDKQDQIADAKPTSKVGKMRVFNIADLKK